MTLNNHRFTTLSADDVAMCRAHSKAVHEQSTNTTTAAGRDEISATFKTYEPLIEFEAGMHMPDDPPLPPSYWDDLEHWLKTLAPAKPAAPQHVVTRIMCGGVTIYTSDQALAARLASTSSADGAVLVGVKLTHSVCIKAHGFADWQIGEIWPGGPGEFQHPENWLPCDKDGWIPHTPTADSTCPVPDGVKFEVRLRNPSIWCPMSAEELMQSGCTCWWRSGLQHDTGPSDFDIISWRPIPGGSK